MRLKVKKNAPNLQPTLPQAAAKKKAPAKKKEPKLDKDKLEKEPKLDKDKLEKIYEGEHITVFQGLGWWLDF